MTSAEVRAELVKALRLDLVGPDRTVGDEAEVLPQAPSRWYLTGFLVPLDAEDDQRSDGSANDDLLQAGAPSGVDDDPNPEPAATRQRYLPSSIGLSVILPPDCETITVKIAWGDYHLTSESPEEWTRRERAELVKLAPANALEKMRETGVPGSGGLRVAYLTRPIGTLAADAEVPAGARTVSVFVVNRRTPAPDPKKDEAFAFQVRIEIEGEFLPRPDLRALASDDWDARVGDLQYVDAGEYAVGHNNATEAEIVEGACRRIRTCWIPEAEVERVAPPKSIPGVELSMDALSQLTDGTAAAACLGPLVAEYRDWIGKQQVPATPAKRKATGEELLKRAMLAASRIERGIALLSDPDCLEAFRVANRVMAAAARRRLGVIQGKRPDEIQPKWYPFQLAFILMNLAGIASPEDPERGIVDLLFFPTGGGKTEAYLGLAAFALVLRRRRHPGIQSAGVSVLMRYTLRLLTLDQLGRAATLICALELERQKDVTQLGEWPFEIGLWVGRAATPNRMGKKGDKDVECAYHRTRRFWDNDRNPSPIPLEECPWCGTKFSRLSFQLLPRQDEPRDLRVSCMNRSCEFGRGRALPIVAVDEPLYRRLPCFMIATVDKFAALPWTGQVGAFFGRVERYDKDGFYGACDSSEGQKLPGGRLPPPDLIIQDELHLISGPLGTMAGLYETALDELAAIERDGKIVKPKIIASTATVRRADTQIRALFNRRAVDIFPPPGPNRKDSFFAKTLASSESNARLYVGIAAQGRSPKVAMLRVYLALLGAAQKWESRLKKRGVPLTPADPYMTLLGYYNALRELGGARRLVEDEIRNRLLDYSRRKRVGETEGLFEDRTIDYEPVELTSRKSTSDVAEYKRRLALPFSDKNSVDVAIATNMISVGLDITRLGLMVVFGQPKGSAEYIQATSRVGRDPDRPGLVVTIFNVHKPRDRSHYERFAAYHQTFYRSVEATSVTPFSPRALDKGLSATLVGLARHGLRPMTPPRGASEILTERTKLEFVIKALADRAYGHSDLPPAEADMLRQRVKERAGDLMEQWSKVADDYLKSAVSLQYNASESGAAKPLLHDYLGTEVKGLPPGHWKMKFRANRSLRDVEANVNLWVKTLENADLEEEAE